MAKITFSGIAKEDISGLRDLFACIQSGKDSGIINQELIKAVIRGRYQTHFWWPSEREKAEWLDRWDATPPEKRHDDPTLKIPWDFGSWIDAIENADIDNKDLVVNDNGTGKLIFDQLSHPSGGLEATEQVIKMFGGVIEENNAI